MTQEKPDESDIITDQILYIYGTFTVENDKLFQNFSAQLTKIINKLYCLLESVETVTFNLCRKNRMERKSMKQYHLSWITWICIKERWSQFFLKWKTNKMKNDWRVKLVWIQNIFSYYWLQFLTTLKTLIKLYDSRLNMATF